MLVFRFRPSMKLWTWQHVERSFKANERAEKWDTEGTCGLFYAKYLPSATLSCVKQGRLAEEWGEHPLHPAGLSSAMKLFLCLLVFCPNWAPKRRRVTTSSFNIIFWSVLFHGLIAAAFCMQLCQTTRCKWRHYHNIFFYVLGRSSERHQCHKKCLLAAFKRTYTCWTVVSAQWQVSSSSPLRGSSSLSRLSSPTMCCGLIFSVRHKSFQKNFIPFKPKLHTGESFCSVKWHYQISFYCLSLKVMWNTWYNYIFPVTEQGGSILVLLCNTWSECIWICEGHPKQKHWCKINI